VEVFVSTDHWWVFFIFHWMKFWTIIDRKFEKNDHKSLNFHQLVLISVGYQLCSKHRNFDFTNKSFKISSPWFQTFFQQIISPRYLLHFPINFEKMYNHSSFEIYMEILCSVPNSLGTSKFSFFRWFRIFDPLFNSRNMINAHEIIKKNVNP